MGKVGKYYNASLFPGDNQGVKFLRRFKQLLNPAQVFELSGAGPRLGLRLFRHFAPIRVLVCSGDGSVGWVLQEVDKLEMHVSTFFVFYLAFHRLRLLDFCHITKLLLT